MIGIDLHTWKIMWARAAPWAKPLAIRTRLTSVIVVRQCLISVSPDNALVTSPSRSHISSVVGNVSLRERIPWKVGTSLINRLGDQVEIKIFQTEKVKSFRNGKIRLFMYLHAMKMRNVASIRMGKNRKNQRMTI